MAYPTTSTSKDTVTASLLNDPLAVPSYGVGTFSIKAQVHISAPSSTVMAALRDTSTWEKWNTFTPICTITSPSSSSTLLTPGAKLTTRYALTPGKQEEQKLEVTVVDTAGLKRVAWISLGKSKWQLWSERVMEFRDDNEGGCEFVVFETFGGLLAGAAKGKVGPLLVERFGDVARDLKAFVEK